jgi:hypothetical protein
MTTINKAFRVKTGLAVEGGAILAPAGTTSYPPLLLTSGTNLTSATAGAFEFDGTNFYLTPSSTRKTISFTDHVHGNLTSAGAIGSTSGLVVLTGASGVLTTLAAGTTSQYLRGDGSWQTVATTDTNYYPSTIVFNAGSTSGPTLDLTMSGSGAPDLTAVAIPSASATASGVVTTAAQTFAGVKTFSSSPIVPTPTNATDAANKAYVDSAAAGIEWKQSVRVATTADAQISTAYANGSVVDGVTLVTGDRILIKNQTTGSQNGIYVVASGGTPNRATDADTGAELAAATAVFVEEGTLNADSGWVLTNNGTITVGTTALVFTQFTGLGQVTAGTGLAKSGNTLSINTAVVPTTSGGFTTTFTTTANTALTLPTSGTVLSTAAAYIGSTPVTATSSTTASISGVQRFIGNSTVTYMYPAKVTTGSGADMYVNAGSTDDTVGSSAGILRLGGEENVANSTKGGTNEVYIGHSASNTRILGDLQLAGVSAGILKVSGVNNDVSVAVAGTDYITSASKLSVFAATTSSELRGVISDETGTGSLVFATSPTLVTPTLGVASATSINKVAITAPASSATLTLANGSTLATVGAYATTLTSTAATSLTLPTSGTLIANPVSTTGSTSDLLITGQQTSGAATSGGDVVIAGGSGTNASGNGGYVRIYGGSGGVNNVSRGAVLIEGSDGTSSQTLQGSVFVGTNPNSTDYLGVGSFNQHVEVAGVQYRTSYATAATVSTPLTAPMWIEGNSSKSAKIVITATTANDVHVVEVLVAQNAAGNFYVTTYGEVTSNASLFGFTCSGTSDIVVTPVGATATDITVASMAYPTIAS